MRRSTLSWCRKPRHPERWHAGAAMALGLLAALGAGGYASAQPTAADDALPSESLVVGADTADRGPFTTELRLRQTYDLSGNLDRSSGHVSIARTALGVGLRYRPNDQWVFAGNITGEYSNYDFSSRTTLAPAPPSDPGRRGDPFDDFYEVSSFVRATRFFDNNYLFTVGGFIGAHWEDSASFSDSITGGGIIGVGYRFSDKLTLTLGGGFQTRLEDDVRFAPLFAIRWDITDTVKLETEGLGLKLSSELNDRVTVGLLGQYQRREYRLNDRHDNEFIDDGVLRDARAEVSLLAEWKPMDRLTLEARAGVSVWQRYELLNDNGRRVAKDNTDPAPFLALSVGFAF